MPSRRPALARAAIALVATGLAVQTIRAGLATSIAGRDPQLAARIAPEDARIAAKAARDLLGRRGPSPGPDFDRLTVRALRRDVTVTLAIELRALRFETTGDRRRAARLFALSDSISRRSLPTRLWLIQRSVERGDVAGALKDFDLALRTSTNAPPILFPVLARAAGDPALVPPIARLLDRPSDWRISFFNYGATEGRAAPAMAKVVLAMRGRSALRDNRTDEVLVARLVEDRAFGLARRVSDAMRPGSGPSEPVADPRFERPDQRFPFGWDLTQGGTIWAARETIAGRPALAYHAAPDSGGVVARQLLTLDAGAYRLAASTAADGIAPAPTWTIACAEGDARAIARLDQPLRRGATGAVEFTVPARCTGQWLTLTLGPSDAPDGQSGAVASIGVTQTNRMPAAAATSRSALVGGPK